MQFRPMFSCFYVFSLGTALLYRTAVCAATMYAQNGGKAFAQAPAAVSSLRKAGMKNMPLFFTWREKLPKRPFPPLGRTTKSRRALLFRNARRHDAHGMILLCLRCGIGHDQTVLLTVPVQIQIARCIVDGNGQLDRCAILKRCKILFLRKAQFQLHFGLS